MYSTFILILSHNSSEQREYLNTNFFFSFSCHFFTRAGCQVALPFHVVSLKVQVSPVLSKSLYPTCDHPYLSLPKDSNPWPRD